MKRRALRAFLFIFTFLFPVHSWPTGSCPAQAEDLVILASPAVAAPMRALAQAFEAAHQDVRVRLSFDRALDLRRTVAAFQNDGRHFLGTGPVHLIAPGDDELLTRLASKDYLLPDSTRTYAVERLVLVAPEALADAPSSFEALAREPRLRVAVADPVQTELGRRTKKLLVSLGLLDALRSRFDVAASARSVLDHVLNGQSDVGILAGPDAVLERERVRIVAAPPQENVAPLAHSIAADRFCPDRPLCRSFLSFVGSPEARAALAGLGYDVPEPASGGRSDSHPR